MSHFTVAIITEGEPTAEQIEKALAPYQENNMCDCPKEYLEFHSYSKEYKEEYETGTTEKVRLNDGTLVYPWADCLYKKVTEEEFNKAKEEKQPTMYRCNKHYVKYKLEDIGAELVTIPFKELYPTFENYLEDYHDLTKDEETLDYGYWENPNAKWDWWQIGGRWAGLLKVSLDCENCGIGEKSWGWGSENPYTNTDKYKKVDSARIKDLIFPDYEKEYEKAKRFWEMLIEGQPPKNTEEQEQIKWNYYRPEYYLKTYVNKETYAECEATFHTYAIITKDGRWVAKGEMGFWGISSEEKDQVVEYIKKYKENVFDNATDNDYITIVDCHI